MTTPDLTQLALAALRLTCLRCGHTWLRRYEKMPTVCPSPKCKSKFWQTYAKTKVKATEERTDAYDSAV